MKIKGIHILVFALLFSGKIYAQGNTLVVFSEQGERFWVILNGIKQNAKAAQNVKITGLYPNAWKIKITFENQDLKDIDKVIGSLENDFEITYQIKKNKKKQYVLRGFSAVTKNDLFQNPDNQNVTVYHPEEIKTDNSEIEIEENKEDKMNIKDEYEPNKNLNPQDKPCNYPVADSEFKEVQEKIKTKSFEQDKFLYAKQFAKSVCLSAIQVKEIMKIFDFEQTKLDFAKLAYDTTYDKNNYYQINELFDFNISIEELEKYIESKK